MNVLTNRFTCPSILYISITSIMFHRPVLVIWPKGNRFDIFYQYNKFKKAIWFLAVQCEKTSIQFSLCVYLRYLCRLFSQTSLQSSRSCLSTTSWPILCTIFSAQQSCYKFTDRKDTFLTCKPSLLSILNTQSASFTLFCWFALLVHLSFIKLSRHILCFDTTNCFLWKEK